MALSALYRRDVADVGLMNYNVKKFDKWVMATVAALLTR